MRLKKLAVAALLGGGLAVAGATAAYATVVNAGGGTWSYGIVSLAGNNWSDYYHSGVWHGSSVTGNAGLVRSACTQPGVWSYSTAYDSNPFRIDQAYWRYC